VGPYPLRPLHLLNFQPDHLLPHYLTRGTPELDFPFLALYLAPLSRPALGPFAPPMGPPLPRSPPPTELWKLLSLIQKKYMSK